MAPVTGTFLIDDRSGRAVFRFDGIDVVVSRASYGNPYDIWIPGGTRVDYGSNLQWALGEAAILVEKRTPAKHLEP